MITIPPSKPNKWHKRRDWTDYATKLFRYYSRRRDYALRLEEDSGIIAAVNPTSKIVILDSNFVQGNKTQGVIRNTPTGMKDKIIINLKGYLAHEAAHVRFSSTKPHGILGRIWNSIEDERIERLMTQQHPHLEDVFTFLGDTHLTRSWSDLKFTPLEGVLVWRWVHDHPTLKWTCTHPEVWTTVQPLVEAAWAETNPDEVAVIAQRILTALNLPEQPDIPPVMLSPFLNSPEPSPTQSTQGDAPTEDNQEEEESTDERMLPGSEGTAEPDAPEVLPESPDHVQARDLLQEVEGHARDLANALAITEKPTLPTNHQSRGKFDYGRYATGAQRTYRHRTTPTRKTMPRITLLHDTSGSMGYASNPDNPQHHAIRATMMLQRACELSRTPLDIITFDTHPIHLVKNTDNHETARALITRINSYGSTVLHPALQQALGTHHPTREEHLVIIYCDGEIDQADAQHCHHIVNANPNVTFLPVLIGQRINPIHFNTAFGRSAQVAAADKLASTLKTWINTNLN